MTVGELIKKLRIYDASAEVIFAINTDEGVIPGRLDSVGHNVDKHVVMLVHTCVDPDINANAVELDGLINGVVSGEIIGLGAFIDSVLTGKR